MTEDKELLNALYENANMGYNSTLNLLNIIKTKENNIKNIISNEVKEYEKYLKEIKKISKKNKVDIDDIGFMAKIGSKIGIMMETLKDNSDSALSQMIVEGLTMGSTSLISKINKYEKESSKRIIKLSKEYLKFLEEEIEKLKKYM